MALRTVTFRVPEDKLIALDSAAEVQHRDRSYLLNEAISQYLSLHEYHRELIEEGLRQDDAGDLLDHKDVRKLADGWATKTEAR